MAPLLPLLRLWGTEPSSSRLSRGPCLWAACCFASWQGQPPQWWVLFVLGYLAAVGEGALAVLQAAATF